MFEAVVTVLTPPGGLVSVTNTYTYTPTLPWGLNDPRRVTFDNGNGHTFDEHLFAQGDLIGIRLSRLGADAADTFTKIIGLPDSALLTYNARCGFLCP